MAARDAQSPMLPLVVPLASCTCWALQTELFLLTPK